MGNSLMVRSKKAKVMKIDGDTFRLKTPAIASDVTKEYPGYVLLDSEAVKHLGVRAKPLEPNHILKPKKTYFLVDLPAEKGDKRDKLPYRRVMSGIQIGARERLELLMLSRRTVSDVSVAKSDGGDESMPGERRVTLRLPRYQIRKLVEESHDTSEVAERIIGLYLESSGEIQGGRDGCDHRKKLVTNSKAGEKRVSFAGDGRRRQIDVLWNTIQK